MKVKKFQMGGEMSQGAPAPEQGAPGAPAGGPEEQIAQMAMEIVQQLGPEAAAMLAQAIMQVLEQGAGGPAPEGEPVYAKKGGKLTMIGRRQPTLTREADILSSLIFIKIHKLYNMSVVRKYQGGGKSGLSFKDYAIQNIKKEEFTPEALASFQSAVDKFDQLAKLDNLGEVFAIDPKEGKYTINVDKIKDINLSNIN